MNKYDEIISSCDGLIYTIINNYFRGYNIEDLYQVGVIGVIKAYDKYKENRSTKFSTYAYKWIYGEIYAYINNSKLLKVNTENIRLYKKIIEANNYLCQTLMRNPSTNEIALYIDELPSVVESSINSMQSIDSLDRIVFEGDKDINMYEMIKDKKDYYDTDYLYLEEELSKLPDNERKLIYLRYFKDKTQSEVSKILGIHQVEISRTESKILKKIRKNYQNVA